jgi:hypothetical protein
MKTSITISMIDSTKIIVLYFLSLYPAVGVPVAMHLTRDFWVSAMNGGSFLI